MNKKEKLKKIFTNKKVIISLVAIILIILVAVAAILVTKENKKEAKEKIQAITTKDVIKDEKFDGLTFTNTTLIKEKGQYVLSMDVTNTSKETVNVKQVNVVFKDKSGNTLVTLLGYIGDEMKANDTKTITSSVGADAVDLSKAKSKTIEAYKNGQE